MENLQRIDFDGQRVITTKQLADAYNVDAKVITQNFSRNRKRYTEGKHYIVLTGNEKQEMIKKLQFEVSSRTRRLYLWTEKGAILHAKSLGSDEAWAVSENLVDFYFREREKIKNQIIEKTNVKNENYICENPKANVPCPMLFSWYDKNQKKIQIICKEYHVKPKDLYHAILSKIGTKYNFEEAKIIYQQQLGRPPAYPMDVVDFFPEMSAIADQVVNNLLTGL